MQFERLFISYKVFFYVTLGLLIFFSREGSMSVFSNKRLPCQSKCIVNKTCSVNWIKFLWNQEQRNSGLINSEFWNSFFLCKWDLSNVQKKLCKREDFFLHRNLNLVFVEYFSILVHCNWRDRNLYGESFQPSMRLLIGWSLKRKKDWILFSFI